MEDLGSICARIEAAQRAAKESDRLAEERIAARDRRRLERIAAAEAKVAPAKARLRAPFEARIEELLLPAHRAVEAMRRDRHWKRLLAHVGGVLESRGFVRGSSAYVGPERDWDYRFSISSTAVWLDERFEVKYLGDTYTRLLHSTSVARLFMDVPRLADQVPVLRASITWLADLARGGYADRTADRLTREIERDAAWRRRHPDLEP